MYVDDSIDDVTLDTSDQQRGSDTPFNTGSPESGSRSSSIHGQSHDCQSSGGDQLAFCPVTPLDADTEMAQQASDLNIIHVHLLAHFKQVSGQWYEAYVPENGTQELTCSQDGPL